MKKPVFSTAPTVTDQVFTSVPYLFQPLPLKDFGGGDFLKVNFQTGSTLLNEREATEPEWTLWTASTTGKPFVKQHRESA